MTEFDMERELSREAPDGWRVNPAAPHHISVCHDSGRSIALAEHQGEWRVTGLCQYGDADHPRFALDATAEEAVSAAVDAMKAANRGDPEDAEIAARASDLETPSLDGTAADIPSLSRDDSDAGHADDETQTDSDSTEDDTDGSDTGQASLSEF